MTRDFRLSTQRLYIEVHERQGTIYQPSEVTLNVYFTAFDKNVPDMEINSSIEELTSINDYVIAPADIPNELKSIWVEAVKAYKDHFIMSLARL